MCSKKYFYNNTLIANVGFDCYAKPSSISKGSIIAFIYFFGYRFSANIKPVLWASFVQSGVKKLTDAVAKATQSSMEAQLGESVLKGLDSKLGYFCSVKQALRVKLRLLRH